MVFKALLSCLAFAFLSHLPIHLPKKNRPDEICNNAVDDDNDGLIDLNDPDCVCEVLEPISLIPNPSFEDMNCCPNDRSQLNCAAVWIFIPNAFSPNQDGINDLFRVYHEAGLVEQSDLTIFDRWGAMIYQGSEWDGKYEGIFVNPGVFVYLAKLKMNDGIERQFSGSVTVVR